MRTLPDSAGSLSSVCCAVSCTLRSFNARLKPRRSVKVLHALRVTSVAITQENESKRRVRFIGSARVVVRASIPGHERSSNFKSGSEPLAFHRIRFTIERYHIEPAWQRRELRVRLQESLRRARNAFALGAPDRSRAAAERAMSAVAHLHEYQRICIAHHQIQFAETRGEVAREQFQPCASQMLERAILEDVAGRARAHCAEEVAGAGSIGAVSSPAATGRATPSWKLTHTGTRCTRPCASSVNWPVAPGTYVPGCVRSQSR